MAEVPYERINTTQDQSASVADTNRRKQQHQQPRQLLSCTKCRERKVKCDRTKPCSACCARGSPRDCHFIAEDGNYAPIQQSYKLRKLRAENLRLKERLRAYQISIDDDDPGHEASPDALSKEGISPPYRRRTTKQKRFQSCEWQDSIYFGSPGLATVVSDFTSADTSSLPLSYAVPHGSDMFRSLPTYPFPTLFSAAPDECFLQLLSCLPVKEELMRYLRAFQGRVYQVPAEMTSSEIEGFLSDARKNSQLFPATLALLFGLIALGAQHSAWDRGGGRWDAKAIEVETQKGNVYIAAAMQALRLASFTHKPSFSAIQTLLMIGSYLTNDGRMLDAYTLFGTTIRLAQSIGLHRHPKYLNSAPMNEKDCAVRQKVWWHMLHLDEHMSMTLGRPLGISSIGDNPWPTELRTDPVLLRFGEFANHFTVLARQIMSSDRLTSARIDELTDALRRLLDTMPETLQFDESWMRPETILPDLSAIATVYFCKAHMYIVLLNRQRTEKHTTSVAMSIVEDTTSSFQAFKRSSPLEYSSDTYPTQAVPRGRTLVLASSEALLSAYMFFYHRDPAALIDWSLAQQAFNSCMILLLDAIECRTITVGALKAEQVFVVFKDLHENNVHKLAGLAVEKISSGLQELRGVVAQPPGVLPRGQANAAVQSVGQDEATHASCMTDSVMGHTGMFLLEDPGQQAVANEAFVPTAWGDPRISTQPKEQRQGPSLFRRIDQKAGTLPSDEQAEISRSADVMQGLRRSTTLQSAPTRYATLSEDDHIQPHGCTALTSPANVSMLHEPRLKTTTDQHGWQTSRGDETLHLHAQLQHDMFLYHQWGRDGSDGSQGHDTPPSAWIDSQDVLHGPQRHSSCPVIPPLNAHPPLLRPHYSSPSNMDRPTVPTSRNTPLRTHSSREYTPFHASQYSTPDSKLSPYNHFVSGSAEPLLMPSNVEATRGFPSTTQGMIHGGQGLMEYSLVINPSTASLSSTLTPLAGSMGMDDWSRHMGREGFS